MLGDAAYARFLHQRDLLQAQLDNTGKQLEVWIGDHQYAEPSFEELAFLEVLLRERSNLFQQLSELDDQFVQQVIRQYLVRESD